MLRNFIKLSVTTAVMVGAILTGTAVFSDFWTPENTRQELSVLRLSPAALDFDHLHGLPVIDAGANPVGSVAEVRVGPAGRVTGAIAEIGGVFGIGGDLVDLEMEQMAIRDLGVDGRNLAVQLLVSKEDIGRLPRLDS